jgi:hypothetical protein
MYEQPATASFHSASEAATIWRSRSPARSPVALVEAGADEPRGAAGEHHHVLGGEPRRAAARDAGARRDGDAIAGVEPRRGVPGVLGHRGAAGGGRRVAAELGHGDAAAVVGDDHRVGDDRAVVGGPPAVGAGDHAGDRGGRSRGRRGGGGRGGEGRGGQGQGGGGEQQGEAHDGRG